MKKIFIGVLAATFLLPAFVLAEVSQGTTQLTLEQVVRAMEENPDLRTQIVRVLQERFQSGSESSAASGSSSANCYTFTRDLYPFAFSWEVAKLHEFLRDEGFLVSGFLYDGSTKVGVSFFQNKYRNEILTPNGLTGPTGNFGPATRAKMNQLHGCQQTTTTSSGQEQASTERNTYFVVKQSGTNEPLSGVQVIVEHENTVGRVGTYNTNSDGRTTVANLRVSERYLLRISRAGYESRSIALVVPFGVGSYFYHINLSPVNSYPSVWGGDQTALSLFVSKPVAGTSYQSGHEVDVSWQIFNSPVSNPVVSIKLINSSGNTVDTESEHGNNTKSFSLSSSLPAGQYKFKVSATISGQILEAWSSWFSVTSSASNNSNDSDDDTADDSSDSSDDSNDSDDDSNNSSDDSNSNTGSPALDVTAPTGGTYSHGQSIPITWTTTAFPSGTTVRLKMLNSSSQEFGNVINIENDGSYSYAPGASVPAGQYHFWVYGTVSGQAVGDFSSWFTLAESSGDGGNSNSSSSSISISSPNGGSYQAGGSLSYSWSSSGLAGAQTLNVKVVNQSNSTVYSTTATNSAGNGTLTLPASLSPGQYRLWIFASIGGVNTEAWSSWFTVTVPPPSLSVSAPAGGSYAAGQQIPITWTTTNFPAGTTVNLKMLNSSSQSFGQVNGTENDGSYSYVPGSSVPAGQYRFWIYGTVNGQAVGGFSAYFTRTTN